ncbi:MAG: hypothetical protein IPQ04_15310 [Saprospiraceae bacterium]|nr:hypothetical protein [Saprospiraceae bacterium]
MDLREFMTETLKTNNGSIKHKASIKPIYFVAVDDAEIAGSGSFPNPVNQHSPTIKIEE